LPGGVTNLQLDWDLGIFADLIVTTDVIADGISSSEIQERTDGIAGSFTIGVATCLPNVTAGSVLHAEFATDSIANNHADYLPDRHTDGISNRERR
jgi:hypothetical protein